MTSPLLLLPESDLPPLIAGLRSGRLTLPAAAAVIERLLGHTGSAEITDALEQFHRLGFSEAQIAVALDLVCQDRRRRPRLEEAINLVTSGPDAPGIANRDTRVVVRELFANAERSVLVAGYAVHQGQSVFEALADRMAALPALNVRFVLEIQRGPGHTTLPILLVRRFADRFRNKQWPNDRPLPQLFFDPRSLDPSSHERSAMHAKCIVVDGLKLFISSANFTEAAQHRNLEVGLLIHSPSLAQNLATYFDTLIAHRLLLPAE
jgi:phosphatidylserine/phosphatidylglycerophosphate/cardiolipin synthase-like enzyme